MELNNYVWLCIEKRILKNINKHPKIKLAPCFYGPFKIIKIINPNAYTLDIPHHWHIHDLFHISLSRKFKGDPPNIPIMEELPLIKDDE